ncbi:MAG: hypothetical protein GC178_00980 [Flavobacteriales bacterium]|nr:hypothetical protein [Flavobacteriales bacterium]
MKTTLFHIPPIRLTAAVLEKKLKEEIETENKFQNGVWSVQTKEHGLLVDLSQLRWVEFGAAAQLLLLIESALKQDVSVDIAMPLDQPSSGENKKMLEIQISNPRVHRQMQNVVGQRRVARNFLYHIQFERAAMCYHVETGDVRIIRKCDFRSGKPLIYDEQNVLERANVTESDFESKKTDEISYKAIVPLTWVQELEDSLEVKNLKEFLHDIIGNEEKGLAKIDARSITGVVLNELVKNLKEHANPLGESSTTHALLGVILLPNSVIDENSVGNNESFFSWLKEGYDHHLEIYFGDTGQGVVNSLKKQFALSEQSSTMTDDNIVLWAFDKWYSRKSERFRGTKGLYRIQRIVNKYDGLMSIRSARVEAGYQKGGYDGPARKFSANELGYMPGSFIKMTMVPYRELAKVNPPLTTPTGKTPGVIVERVEITANDLRVDNFFEKQHIELEDRFKSIKDRTATVFIFLDFKLESIQPISEKLVEDILNSLTQLRHPNPLVVYGFPEQYGYEKLEGCTDSVNEYLRRTLVESGLNFNEEDSTIQDPESFDSEFENIADPILVLTKEGEHSWCGIYQDEIMELLKVLSSEGKVEATSYLSNKGGNEILEIKKFVNNDPLVHQYANVDGKLIWELLYGLNGLIRYYGDKLIQELEKQVSEQKKGYCDISPNLSWVKRWVNMETLLEFEEDGFGIALTLLFKSRHGNARIDLKSIKILVDNEEARKIAKPFCKWMGIDVDKIVVLSDEVDRRIPRRSPIFSRGDQVLILTTLISSFETVNRLAKTVYRGLAHPIAILGLVQPKTQGSVNIWGHDELEILSLAEYDLSVTPMMESIKSGVKFIEPYSYESIIAKTKEALISTDLGHRNQDLDEVLEMVEKGSALHFSHVGKNAGRHFTFYLSAIDFLAKNDEVIMQRYYDEIDSWAESQGIEDFEIWTPTPVLKVNHLEQISKHLEERYHKYSAELAVCVARKVIKRNNVLGNWVFYNEKMHRGSKSDNVLIIDWGSLNGTTVQQMVNFAASEAKTNIKVCILFSQLWKPEQEMLEKIVQVKRNPRVENIPVDIFTNSVKVAESESVEDLSSTVSVKFLYRLPLRYFEMEECPVCAQIEALKQFEVPNKLINDFNVSRKERLQIRDRTTEVNHRPRDFYGEQLTGSIISEMMKFKVLLDEALLSTEKRFLVVEHLRKLEEGFQVGKIQGNTVVQAVIYFLSVEKIWMHRPPLEFRIARDLIAQISLKIALAESTPMQQQLKTRSNVVRIKFAAVTVLRSADKVLFIENLGGIFRSAFIEEKFSEAIVQNLFYHLHSFITRDYHSSQEYYDTIIQELNDIRLIEGISDSMQDATQFLELITEKRKTGLRIPFDSKLAVVKSLMVQRKRNFDRKYNHYDIIERYRALSPAYRGKIENFIQGVNNDQSFVTTDYFQSWCQKLMTDWKYVAQYLNDVIFGHLEKIKDLFDSKSFNVYYMFRRDLEEAMRPGVVIGSNDDFTILVKLIQDEPSVLLEKNVFEKYIGLLESMYVNYLRFDKRQLENNSVLNTILSQLNVDLVDNVNHALESFKAICKTGLDYSFSRDEATIYQAFIFEPLLKNLLQHIFEDNIHEKDEDEQSQTPLSVQVSLKQIDNSFELLIENSVSDPEQKNNLMGGLSKWREQILDFDGELKWGFNKDRTKFYRQIILLKF